MISPLRRPRRRPSLHESPKRLRAHFGAGAVEPLERRVLLSTYYLSPTGSDAAAGSEAAPWKTLPFAQGRAQPGDTLLLRGGSYAGGFSIDTPNLTIRNYPGERPVISSPTTNSSVQQTISFDVTSSGSRLQGLEVSGGYYYTLKFESDWSNGQSNGGATNITIEDCLLHDSGRDVVKITPGCDDVAIRRTEIYNSGRRDASNAEGIDNVNGDRMLVQDCYIHDIATNGLYAKGGAGGVVIERNRIERTGGTGVALGFVLTDAPWFDADNTSFYESIDSTVRNNIISDTPWAGIGLYGALRPRVYNNTLVDVAQSSHGGVMIARGEVDTSGDEVADVFPASRDAVVSNNVIVTSSRHSVLVRSGGHAGTLTMASNRYFKSGGGGAASFSDERSGFVGGLAGWKTQVGTDAGSTEGDPLLDATTFRLTASSPLINAATDLSSSGFSDDVDGEARPAGAWDVGADERGGSTPGPDVTAPTLSAIATSNVTVSAATVSWTTSEAADAQVEYGTTAAYGFSTALDAALGASHSLSLSGLSAGTVYHYRVKSRDAAGNLAVSSDRTFTTAAAPDTTAPAISGVSASGVSAGGATINWTTNEASDTQVEYGTTAAYGSSTPLNAAKVTSHGAGLSGLAANTTYHYRVKSRDAAGNLATSADFIFTTTAAADTTAPVIAAVTVSGLAAAGATIGWSTDEAGTTQVEFGTTAAYGGATPLVTALATAHEVVLDGLSPGTTYHYRVKSTDAAGNVAVSTDFTFTTAAANPPPTEKKLVGSIGKGNGRKPKLTFTDADGTLVTATIAGGGTADVFMDGGEVAMEVAGTGPRTTLTLTSRRGTGDSRVTLGSVHVDGSLRGLKAMAADLRGTFAVNGSLGTAALGSIAGGTLAAAGSVAGVQVAGGVAGARVLAGVGLGSDWRVGGTGDAADAATPAVIRRVRVGGDVAGSVFAAGVAAGNGVYGDGDDAVAGGGDSGIMTINAAPRGTVDDATRFEGGRFGVVSIARRRVVPAADPRFVLLS